MRRKLSCFVDETHLYYVQNVNLIMFGIISMDVNESKIFH